MGLAGVAIDSVKDANVLFDGITLDEVCVSMTMNGAVLPVMDIYIRADVWQKMELGPERIKYSERGGEGDDFSLSSDNPSVVSNLRCTIQNDVLKDFMVRDTYI